MWIELYMYIWTCSHRAQPHSAPTELTDFRGAAKRRTRGGHGLDTEPSDTELRGTSPARPRGGQEEGHRAQPQSPATKP